MGVEVAVRWDGGKTGDGVEPSRPKKKGKTQ